MFATPHIEFVVPPIHHLLVTCTINLLESTTRPEIDSSRKPVQVVSLRNEIHEVLLKLW